MYTTKRLTNEVQSMRFIQTIVRFAGVTALMLATIASLTVAPAVAQQAATPASISCEPSIASAVQRAGTPVTAPEAPGDLTSVKMGFVPVSIFAPVFVGKEKGYFAEEGIDLALEPFPGGADPVVLTASGQLDLAIGGAGPAFWNAVAQGLPITVIAPGHAEGNPVATPLMISAEKCRSGEITSIADLEGKRVSVNAPGATEYWLNSALSTGGLTINDIELQALAFPDAVAALQAGAIDAAMVGEPLATKAEQDGIAVRLATDFPVYDVQPTLIYANDGWLEENPELAEGFATGYMRAVIDMSENGFTDPTNLSIIEQYTGVPAELIAASVPPVYAVDGVVNAGSLLKLQSFFRERDFLRYEEDLDPASFIDQQYINSAMAELNPNQP
ncbi:ABC transporter substrate-binding protein [soil metagenome]